MTGDWFDERACKHMDPKLFWYPDRPMAARLQTRRDMIALTACITCTVTIECATAATSEPAWRIAGGHIQHRGQQ